MPNSKTGVLIGTPGIGGAVWHAPALYALAAARGPLTLFARTSAQAGAIFGHEPWFDGVIPYKRRKGSVAAVTDYLELVRSLKQAALDEIWIFHDHAIYAMAAAHAGVTHRIGPGLPKQEIFLSAGEIIRSDLPPAGEGGVIESTRALLRANGISVSSAPPRLSVNPEAKSRLSLFRDHPRPWFVFGVTCDDARRRWIPHRYAELCAELVRTTGGTVFFVGGPNHAGQIHETTRYLEGVGGWVDTSRIPLPLDVSVALISLADVFIGSDSGPMNIAAAVGTPTYGLFGNHKPHGSIAPEVRVVLPDPARDNANGMEGITTAALVERLGLDDVFRQVKTA